MVITFFITGCDFIYSHRFIKKDGGIGPMMSWQPEQKAGANSYFNAYVEDR